MSNSLRKRALGIFPSRKETEQALRKLRKSYFPMDNISVVAKKKKIIRQGNIFEFKQFSDCAYEKDIPSVITNGELSEITISLAGLTTVAIPEVGSVILAGTAGMTIAKTIGSRKTTDDSSSLVAGLVKLGISEGIAEFYEHRIKQGNYLIIIESSKEKILLAEILLKRCGIKEWEVYDVEAVEFTTNKEVNSYIRGVGSFPSQACVESAINQLINADFPLNKIILITCYETEHNWFPNLIVRHHLDNSPLEFPEERRQFFQSSLDRGEYLLIVDGTEDEFHCAEKILSRCGIHGFYVYDFRRYDNWYHRL